MFSLVVVLALTASPDLTGAELETFGKNVAADLTRGADGISPHVDFRELVERSLTGVKASGDFRDRFMKGLQQGFPTQWTALAQQTANGTAVSFRKVVELDGVSAVQLRLIQKSGAFDFIELLVRKNPAGQINIIDLYDLVDGALRSEDLRALAIPLIDDVSPVAVEQTLGKDPKLTRNVEALRSINEAIQRGDDAKVRSTWKKLPTDVREHRLFFKPYISALARLKDGDAEYERAMGRYLALYPDDAAAQVMAIDFNFLHKKWPQCLAAIDAVEKRAGRDAWFDVLRGSVALQQKKRADAKKFFESATALEPMLRQPYMHLIDLALDEKKWADASSWMTAAEKNLGLTFDVRARGFEAFAASVEGQAYAKTHPPQPRQ